MCALLPSLHGSKLDLFLFYLFSDGYNIMNWYPIHICNRMIRLNLCCTLMPLIRTYACKISTQHELTWPISSDPSSDCKIQSVGWSSDLGTDFCSGNDRIQLITLISDHSIGDGIGRFNLCWELNPISTKGLGGWNVVSKQRWPNTFHWYSIIIIPTIISRTLSK